MNQTDSVNLLVENDFNRISQMLLDKVLEDEVCFPELAELWSLAWSEYVETN